MKLILLFIWFLPVGAFSQELCAKIETEIDKFTGERNFTSPILDDVHFIKSIKSGRTVYYLSLSTIGSTPSYGKGVYVLFNDGSKISKPLEENDVDVNSGRGFDITAFISLNPSDIKMLSEKVISDFRIYIYDQKVLEGEKYRSYFKCMVGMK